MMSRTMQIMTMMMTKKMTRSRRKKMKRKKAQVVGKSLGQRLVVCSVALNCFLQGH